MQEEVNVSVKGAKVAVPDGARDGKRPAASVSCQNSSNWRAMASTTTKKRKRDDVDEPEASGEQATLRLLEEKESAIGPILGEQTGQLGDKPPLKPSRIASFPAITPSKSIGFKCYSQGPTRAKDTVEFSSQKLVVAGESDTVEFFSTNESEAAAVGCR